MSKVVTYALLHQGAFIPGAGTLGNTFPPAGKTLVDLKMSYSEAGLSVNFSYKNSPISIIIPSANVVLMTIVPDAPVKTTLKSA